MKDSIKEILRESVLHEEHIKFDMVIPEDIVNISNILKKNGYKLYVVGGAVRDAILNIQPKDYDLVTDSIPDKVEELMTKAGYKTLPTGKAFGVINIFTNEGEYEVATFRSDGKYSDSRRPDSVTFGDIINDSKRRDLTMNALYYDIDAHEIIDLVGGVNDIKNGVVRTVGSSEERFGEDKLRILRAIRLSARFGSNLEPSIDAALKKDARLDGVSGERIRDEFIKGIKSAKSVKYFLELIDKYHLFDYIFKGLSINKQFIDNKDYIIVIAILLKNNQLNLLSKKLNELKYATEEVKGVTFLVALLSLSIDTVVALKRAQQHSGITLEQIKEFGRYEHIEPRLLKAFIDFKLTVSGPEAMDKTGLPQGKELGQAIHKMETDNFKKLLK